MAPFLAIPTATSAEVRAQASTWDLWLPVQAASQCCAATAVQRMTWRRWWHYQQVGLQQLHRGFLQGAVGVSSGGRIASENSFTHLI